MVNREFPREKQVGITAIILTYNEVENIGRCLAGLSRVLDVVIVDSGSLDGTLERALAVRPDTRVYMHPFVDFGDQRNWALDNASPEFDWILFVDADEYCDPDLLDEISELIDNPGAVVGGFIAGRNYFLGKWLKYSTMYPSYQLRLLKKGSVRFRKEGHGQREIASGPLSYLRNGWYHDAFSKGVHQWVDRHNRYASDEALRIVSVARTPINWRDFLGSAIARRRLLRELAIRIPFRPFFRFVFCFFIRGGVLDGAAGFRYCSLVFSYQLIINAKVAELRENQMREGGL